MGSGLCRRKDGKRRAMGVDGLYRKIVFNYPKQWTRCSNKHPKSDKNNTKPNKSKSRKKPIISGPYPLDPDRLEGDKWRYVILTRLDTEPPPERPPRTKRHRLQDSAGFGRRGSVHRRRRLSCGRGSGRRPPRPGRRAVDGHGGHHQQQQQQQKLSADQLMELVLKVYRRRGPVGRSLAWPRGRDCETAEQRPGPGTAESGPKDEADSGRDDRPGTESATALVEKPTSPWVWWRCADGRNGLFVHHRRYRRNGFFGSVGRVQAMAKVLLSL